VPSVEVSGRADRTPISIGRYEVVCKLGIGGMADVYLAHQPGPFSAGKLVFIKQLRPAIMDDEQFVEMFADESRIAVRLNHPNVVHTYEVVAENDTYYLALEFLDGKALHQVLKHVPPEAIPLGLHLWVLTQVLAGLHYAHELTDFDGSPMGIVHRDVSPSNVFLTYSGEVKLLDFGIAKSAGAISATREGFIKGKLGYAAPEQCLCAATDARTDLYAVGVMLWEAIAGRRRSIGGTEASTYQARIQGTEQRLEQICPKAPRELVSICNTALARQPEQRFQSALAFRQALENYLRTTRSDASSEQLAEIMRKYFRNDIIEMRRRIEEHMGNSHQLTSHTTGLTKQPQNSAGSTASFSAGANVVGANEHSLTGTNANPPPLVWYKRPLVLAAASLGILGLIGLFLGLVTAPTSAGKSPSATVVVPALASTLGSIPEDTTKTTHREPRPTQPSGQISVAFAATPNLATLTLDGRRISNPYHAVHGLDSISHHLAISLAGYQSVEQEITFDQDVNVRVTLSPKSGKLVASPERMPARTPSVVSPLGSNTPTQKVQTVSQPTAPQPGEDIRIPNSRAKARDIDETDPYKR
jgi:serine/threonine-protein kinase